MYIEYMDSNQEEFLTIEEAAKRLKISSMTVYRMARKGELPAIKIGKVWRISNLKLTQLFDKQNKSK